MRPIILYPHWHQKTLPLASILFSCLQRALISVLFAASQHSATPTGTWGGHFRDGQIRGSRPISESICSSENTGYVQNGRNVISFISQILLRSWWIWCQFHLGQTNTPLGDSIHVWQDHLWGSFVNNWILFLIQCHISEIEAVKSRIVAEAGVSSDCK